MELSLGTRLRIQRERRQISLADIAAETKIKLSLLQGLERDDVTYWPEGIFRRAYVRTYARAIGADPDEVVREFVQLHPDSVEIPPAGATAWPERDAEAAGAPPTRFRRLVTSFAVPARAQRPANGEHTTLGTLAPPRDAPAPVAVEPTDVAAPAEAHEPPVEEEPDRRDTSLSTIADLCTRLARAQDTDELTAVLEDAARTLEAVGLIVWSWDSRAAALKPSLAHGYPNGVLARFPAIRVDAENAVASAFRSGEPSAVYGGDGLTGAVAVPLRTPAGCVGVLALEFQRGGEQCESVRAVATILAAQLAAWFGSTAAAASMLRPVASA